MAKTKTLLISPPSTVYDGDPTVPAFCVPLGLAYLAAFLEKKNYLAAILDAVAEGNVEINSKAGFTRYGLSDEAIENRIKMFAPDVVGITCMYTAYAGDAHRMAKIVKDVNQKILVIFGGAHATIFPELTLKDKNIDIVVLGEGEETLLNIVMTKTEDKDVFKVRGTVVRKKGNVFKNTERISKMSLDEIPFPARHLLPMEKYLKAPNYNFTMRPPSTSMITSRGCPGRCIYCSIHSVWGHRWRGRSPKNVVDEMEMLNEDYGIREIEFFDDSMGVDKKRLEEICDEIINRGLEVKWSTPNGIAHWTLDEKLLEKMKKAGCYRITFGIESGNADTRRFIGKAYDLEQAKRMIQYANKIGMWTISTNIIGFPYETRKQIEDTINFAINSDTDLAIFYLLCPHPGTRAYEIFKKEGFADFDYIFSANTKLKAEDYVKIGKALSGKGVRTKYFSEDQLREILNQSYRKFITKKIIDFLHLIRLFRKIRSFEDLKYVAKVFLYFFIVLLRNVGSKPFSSQDLRKRKEYN